MEKRMKDFNYWQQCQQNTNLMEFNLDRVGLLWLKIKSLTRVNLLRDFATSAQITLTEKN
jgi:hypothetical protein